MREQEKRKKKITSLSLSLVPPFSPHPLSLVLQLASSKHSLLSLYFLHLSPSWRNSSLLAKKIVMEAVMTGNPPLSSVLPWVTTYLFITDSSNDKQLSSSFPTSTMFVYQNLIFKKLFFKFLCIYLSLEKLVPETTFQTFLCLFVIRKVGQRKTFSSQRKIWLGFQKSIFLKNLSGKHFPEVVKNLEMSYYLLIISNLIFKLLIAIYIYFVLNIYF